MAAIGGKLTGCFGIPKNEARYHALLISLHLATIPRDFQEDRMSTAKTDCDEMVREIDEVRAQYPDEKWNEIHADLVRLASVPTLIQTHEKFPNQLKRDIQEILETVELAEPRPRIAAAAR